MDLKRSCYGDNERKRVHFILKTLLSGASPFFRSRPNFRAFKQRRKHKTQRKRVLVTVDNDEAVSGICLINLILGKSVQNTLTTQNTAYLHHSE